MNKNAIIITLVSVIAIFGFLIVAYNLTNQPAKDTYVKEMTVVNADDNVTWSKTKKNVMIEYGDLQCPACKTFHSLIQQEIINMKDPIMANTTFVYRHFPLTIHEHAEEAAYAAQAAAKQNKFFEMVDKLYNNQDAWSKADNVKEIFLGYAKELKLDVQQFEQDMNSSAIKEKVQKDLSSGNTIAGVNATPTFFYNGYKIDNFKSFDEFLARIRAKANK